MTDVIIIGAGMAGLSAALELKRHGVSYLLLEAGKEPGGRALTHTLPSGVHADLGAHWLHGKDNPLQKLVAEYGLPCRKDEAASLYIYKNGTREISDAESWLKHAVKPVKSKLVAWHLEPDCPITGLGRDAEGVKTLRSFATMWNGLDAPQEPSAREFLTDGSTPGGLQIEGGVKALIDKMADDVGRNSILLDTAVTRISAGGGDVRVETKNHGILRAKHIVFTCSWGVLNARAVQFEPPLSREFRSFLSGITMGRMNKIILELDPLFFDRRNIPVDMALELLEQEPPHFCHIRSAGAPLITLFVSGRSAELVEKMDPDSALAYAAQVLSPVKEIDGFESYLRSPPLTTAWVGNPYTRGAYSSCLPGGKRSGPHAEGNFLFCGDTFDDEYPAALAGAFLSGKKAAQMLSTSG